MCVIFFGMVGCWVSGVVVLVVVVGLVYVYIYVGCQYDGRDEYKYFYCNSDFIVQFYFVQVYLYCGSVVEIYFFFLF